NPFLVRAGRNAEAYRLFLLTLDEERRKAAGYVFDSSFDFEAGANPFDWRFKRQSGVDLSLKKTGRKNLDDKSLQIKFLKKPVNFRDVNQNIRLHAGEFKLEVIYKNRDVKGPNPVMVGVFCAGQPKPLSQVALEKSNLQEQSVSTVFRVPNEKCDLQTVTVFNDNFSKSWANLYSGTLLIHDIRIELTGG
ncbi:MAG: hypothetical protein ABJL18_10970, partial [Hyphomicrobiales bacterium]